MNNENYQILIVDDIIKNIEILATILSREGYKIAYSTNGIDAISMINNNKYDLILLDVMMPEVDGFEVCKKLKSNDATKDIPIIFITAKIETDNIVKGFECGAQDYITKPFNQKELISRVKNHLQLKYQRDMLNIYNEELKLTNSSIQKFIYMISHDLKNPLSCIYGYVELLESFIQEFKTNNSKSLSYEQITDEISDPLKYIKISSETMIKYLESLLELSKRGYKEFNLEYININSLVREVIESFSYKIKLNNIDIIIDKLPDIYADRISIEHIFCNLISNAIKYLDPLRKGIIEISGTEQNDNFIFYVKDNGNGIEEQNVEKIFNPFYRQDRNATDGEGMGLAFVQTLVRRHCGKVSCDSIYKIGSTFSFSISKYIKNIIN